MPLQQLPSGYTVVCCPSYSPGLAIGVSLSGAEVYAAQKHAAPSTLKSSDVVSIVRRTEQQRLDWMRQFDRASLPDMAQRVQKEALLLSSYLPAMLSTAQIDAILRRIISESSETDNMKNAKGLVLINFYKEVDKIMGSGDEVKQRLDELWSS